MKMKFLFVLGFLVHFSCLRSEEIVEIVTELKKFFRTHCLHIIHETEGRKFCF
jgi:hypothetical protein